MCSGQELALSATLTLCRDFCLKVMCLRAESVHAVPLLSRRCAADVLQVQVLCPVQCSVPLVWLLGPCPQTVELWLFPNLCEVALEREAEEKVWILCLSGFCVCLGYLCVWIIYSPGSLAPVPAAGTWSPGGLWQPGQCHPHPHGSPVTPARVPWCHAGGCRAATLGLWSRGSPGRAGAGGSRGAAAVAGSSGPAPHTALLFSP